MLEVSPGEELRDTSSDVGSVVARAPFLVVGVDARLHVTFAAGSSLAPLPSAAALTGGDGDRLLASHRALVDVLARSASGEPASTVSVVDHRRIALHAEPLPGGGAVVVCLDVDRTAQAVSRSEQGLRMLFRHIPAGIWATDTRLCVTRAEGSLLEQVPDPLRPVVGRRVQEFTGERAAEGSVLSLHQAALAGRSGTARFRALGRMYDVVLEPLREKGGSVTGCVGFAVDATRHYAREAALQRLEKRLDSAQRLAHVGSWEYDPAADRVEWSEELQRMHGMTPGQLSDTYEGFLSYTLPEDRHLTDAAVGRALHTGEPFEYDHRIVRPDGQVRVLQTRGEVLFGPDGHPSGLFGSCVDITDRWQMLEDRQRTVSLLSATLESTADGLLVVDLDNRVVAFNQRFCRMWQVPASVLETGDSAALLELTSRLVTGADAFVENTRALESESNADREGYDVLQLVDGRIVERFSRPQRLDGRVVGRVWSFRDVTERERLLRNAQLMSDAGRLLASLEVEQAVEAAARVALPLLGVSCALDLFDPGGSRRLFSLTLDGAPEVRLELSRAALSGHPLLETGDTRTRLTVPLMAQDKVLGVLTFLSAEGRRHTRDDLELAGKLGARMVLAFEHAFLYRQAREALDAREQFLSVAAHELRGPATTLQLGLQMMRASGQCPAPALELCERQLQQLERLTDEMLDFTRLRSQRLHFEVEPVDLVQAVRLTANALSRELEASGSTLTVKAPATLVGGWDAGRIEQLVRNLLSNAIKYGRGRPVEVEVSSSGDDAELVVRDQGIGIAADRQPFVFEPFERAVSERHFGGLGLGLFISRAIVEAFGGSIELHSQPEKGSTFRVTLPRKGPSS